MLRLTLLWCAKCLDKSKMFSIKAHSGLDIFDIVVDLRITTFARRAVYLLAESLACRRAASQVNMPQKTPPTYMIEQMAMTNRTRTPTVRKPRL
jgi:hypothetical protein